MANKGIIVTKEEGVLSITLNRPEKLNALTLEMKTGITQTIKEAEQDNEIRVVVITGAGRAFCAGVDLSAFEDITPVSLLQDQQIIKEMILTIVNTSKPVIAAVNGAAVGIGYSLVLACDIIIASEKARFGGVWVLRGLHPDGGATYLLARRLGIGKACELLLTGEIIDAFKAERIGLTNHVVPSDKLEIVTKEIAAALTKGAPLAIGMTKASIYQGLAMDLSTMLDYETRAQAMLSFTEDCKEALAAFSEKREPVFKWR